MHCIWVERLEYLRNDFICWKCKMKESYSVDFRFATSSLWFHALLVLIQTLKIVFLVLLIIWLIMIKFIFGIYTSSTWLSSSYHSLYFYLSVYWSSRSGARTDRVRCYDIFGKRGKGWEVAVQRKVSLQS